uniref:Uncharacterized protein n=1 Tax=Spironucleus salmonicida TaxID=348837 RepID=V6LJ18_9EUKA|eukprot:EST44338.1 Hypothetical protein SS50377_15878 [Spironucleus salmonicida]
MGYTIQETQERSDSSKRFYSLRTPALQADTRRPTIGIGSQMGCSCTQYICSYAHQPSDTRSELVRGTCPVFGSHQTMRMCSWNIPHAFPDLVQKSLRLDLVLLCGSELRHPAARPIIRDLAALNRSGWQSLVPCGSYPWGYARSPESVLSPVQRLGGIVFLKPAHFINRVTISWKAGGPCQFLSARNVSRVKQISQNNTYIRSGLSASIVNSLRRCRRGNDNTWYMKIYNKRHLPQMRRSIPAQRRMSRLHCQITEGLAQANWILRLESWTLGSLAQKHESGQDILSLGTQQGTASAGIDDSI